MLTESGWVIAELYLKMSIYFVGPLLHNPVHNPIGAGRGVLDRAMSVSISHRREERRCDEE